MIFKNNVLFTTIIFILILLYVKPDKHSILIIVLIYLIYLLYYVEFKHKLYFNGGKKLLIVKENNTYYEIDNVFSLLECNTIINLSKNYLIKSTVMGNKINNVRTSHQTWLSDTDYNVKKFNIKLNELINKYSNTKLYYENTEKLQVVCYKTGQEYKPHYDVCNPFDNINEDKTECKKDLKNIGSLRYATILVYLNDNFTGGETFFPNLNVKIKPKMGKVLIFYSLDSKKNTNLDSLHGGLPVKSGIKWICNKWYRLNTVK